MMQWIKNIRNAQHNAMRVGELERALADANRQANAAMARPCFAEVAREFQVPEELMHEVKARVIDDFAPILSDAALRALKAMFYGRNQSSPQMPISGRVAYDAMARTHHFEFTLQEHRSRVAVATRE